MYRQQRKPSEAQAVYERALIIRENSLGAMHPDTATTLINLGTLSADQEKAADAERFYQRALAIQERVLADGHPELAITLSNLGEVYRLQKKYPEAQSVETRALMIREHAFGAGHPEIANTLMVLTKPVAKRDEPPAKRETPNVAVLQKPAIKIYEERVAACKAIAKPGGPSIEVNTCAMKGGN